MSDGTRPHRSGEGAPPTVEAVVVKFSRGNRQVRLSLSAMEPLAEVTLSVDDAAELAERIGHAVTAIRAGHLPPGVETALDLEL